MPARRPKQMMRLGLQTATMAAEAQMVIAMRLIGMAGGWKVSPGENRRMVSEKSAAMLASSVAAGRAMMAGAGPGGVTLAALKPIRAGTRANAKRLALRGPKVPV